MLILKLIFNLYLVLFTESKPSLKLSIYNFKQSIKKNLDNKSTYYSKFDMETSLSTPFSINYID
jgi:hypothetical protein